MIIFRYCAKQLFTTWLSISFILLLVVVSGRFIKYLQQAASGDLNPNVLLSLLVYRFPSFLELVLPLAFFMAVLLVYGRMYSDSEMIALKASGFSTSKLLKYTSFIGLIVALITGVFSLWLTPWGLSNVSKVIKEQQEVKTFDTLTTGRFQQFAKQTVYTERLSEENSKMEQVFIAKQEHGSKNITLLLAESANVEQEGSQPYLTLYKGHRFDITPGLNEGRFISYDTYGIKIENGQEKKLETESWLPLHTLFNTNNKQYVAELQWRLSLPLLVIISTLIAIPLSHVNPRQGKYFRILPGILIFLIYVSMIISTRDAIREGTASIYWNMVAVHLLFFLLGLFMFYFQQIKTKVSKYYL